MHSMYDPKTNSYSNTIEEFPGEHLHKRETTYYLKYNSQKGLYAIEKLFEDYDGTPQEKCFNYHIYLDLLFESVGMIINRFKPQKKSGNILIQSQNNCIEYKFDNRNYPLLNDKSFRNFIEHIDERDEILIENKIYHGTFNLIYDKMDKKMKSELLSEEKQQNNLLNLENMTYTILDVEKYNRLNIVKKVININELKDELTKINNISKTIWNYLNTDF